MSWEYFLAPDGQLREWIRHNTLLAIVLGIPALLILPIVGVALGGIAACAAVLVVIAGYVLIIPLLIVGGILSITFAIKYIKSRW